MTRTTGATRMALFRIAIVVVFLNSISSLATLPTKLGRRNGGSMVQHKNHHSLINVPLHTRMFLTDEKNDELVEASSTDGKENFDAGGFVGYLVPYAAAAFCSVAVTAAFVKFVLLDY